MYFDNKAINLTPKETKILFDELEKVAKRLYPYINVLTPAKCFNYFLKHTSLKEKIIHNQPLIIYIFFQFEDFIKNPKCLI